MTKTADCFRLHTTLIAIFVCWVERPLTPFCLDFIIYNVSVIIITWNKTVWNFWHFISTVSICETK